jgi:hypothetical protein
MDACESASLEKMEPSGMPSVLAKPAVSVSRLVWLMAVIQLSLGLVALGRWGLTGNPGHLDHFFHYEGSLFLTGFALVEYLLSIIAWRLFDAGDMMRSAWFFVMIASGCRLAGLVVANFVSGFASVDLSSAARAAGSAQMTALRDLGLTISSPVTVALLSIGLLLVVRLYRKVGLLRRLRWPDFVLLGVVGIFLGSQVVELTRWLGSSGRPVTMLRGVSWLVDPLMAMLFVEAVLLRRSVVNMGGGLIARCWGAYTAAIFLTSMGDMGIWALNVGFVPWQFGYGISCVWFLASIAYALGPAYQIEAVVRARRMV